VTPALGFVLALAFVGIGCATTGQVLKVRGDDRWESFYDLAVICAIGVFVAGLLGWAGALPPP